ncbi:MAG: ribonuclease PH [Anaerolineales bacterium]|nr:ribonuclease PH [Anaerolineales bacterium]
MTRLNGRSPHHLRPITFQLGYTQWAEGSVLAQFGNTHVLCNATLDNTLPNWLRYSSKKHGWLTAEYAMLPRSTHRRTQREQRWPKGRTQEISRLIGRSLRMAVDLDALGERQVIIDCDVLQADGGTRTAAICGGWIATQLALRPLIAAGDLPESVLTHQIAAISVGIVNGEPLLDLAYEEDVNAEVDFNVVMTGTGDLIEVQGTAEKAPFPRAQLNTLLDLAASGIAQLAEAQLAALK